MADEERQFPGVAELRLLFREEVAANNERIEELIRDAQTEIIRALEALTRANLARMRRLEMSDASAAERLEALEQRVFEIENKVAWRSLSSRGDQSASGAKTGSGSRLS